MGIRSVARLRREQAELREALRRLTENEAEAEGEFETGPARRVTVWGRVTAVVGSDATYGPHLVAQPQVFAGVPPTARDGAGVSVRCHPKPGLAVEDYTVGEYVEILTCRGAMVAGK